MPGRIDVHQHLLPPRYREVLDAGDRTAGGWPASRPWDAKAATAMMDETGIETGMLSLSAPGVHFGGTPRPTTWPARSTTSRPSWSRTSPIGSGTLRCCRCRTSTARSPKRCAPSTNCTPTVWSCCPTRMAGTSATPPTSHCGQSSARVPRWFSCIPPSRRSSGCPGGPARCWTSRSTPRAPPWTSSRTACSTGTPSCA